MAHIAERMTSHYQGMMSGLTVTSCPDPTQIAAYAREVHPEIMFGVPRVWEKIYLGVNAALAADPEKQQKFDEGVAAALEIKAAERAGTATQEQKDTWAFLDAVAFATVRGLLGPRRPDRGHHRCRADPPADPRVVQRHRRPA